MIVFGVLNAALAALNAHMYASDGEPINLAATVFCGLISILIVVDDR